MSATLNKVIEVKGMSCGHCIKAVEGAVKENGAQGKADLDSGLVTVSISEGSDQDQVVSDIRAAIEEEGYEVVSVK